MAAAISVENLGKCYRINHESRTSSRRYRTVRDSLANAAASAFRYVKNRGAVSVIADDFWALREVAFEIKSGEVVGIMGRNGAGKSTLLKILSRVAKPTTGSIRLRGRVGSLLEVGTGFHPELTGRENVYLNGSILGMQVSEIRRRFDQIVDFSGVEPFIDTPVKRYSSGMQVRLAFAVAAHLEPEILIVDEVLAVGDVGFQEKCLGKMQDVSKDGRTVLLVSHNIGAISRLCTRGICLRDGRVSVDGSVDDALQNYVGASAGDAGRLDHNGIGLELSLSDSWGQPIGAWRQNATLELDVNLISQSEGAIPQESAIDLAFYSENGTRVFAVQSDQLIRAVHDRSRSRFRVSITNVGLNCPFLRLDVGVRAAREPNYLALWQRVATIPISHEGIPRYSVGDSLLALPTTIAVG